MDAIDIYRRSFKFEAKMVQVWSFPLDAGMVLIFKYETLNQKPTEHMIESKQIIKAEYKLQW